MGGGGRGRTCKVNIVQSEWEGKAKIKKGAQQREQAKSERKIERVNLLEHRQHLDLHLLDVSLRIGVV